MRIEILAEAAEDLLDGYRFYEWQAPNLGSYFLDSLYSDLESLLVYAGIHRIVMGSTDRSRSASPMPSTTAWRQRSFASTQS